MNAAKYTGSEVKNILGLSPVALGAAGSGTPFFAGDFTNATLLFASTAGVATANLIRSATSNGTFQTWGASVTGTASGLAVRSFVLGSSANWYRLHYSNGAGSATMCAIIQLHGAEHTPVDQASGTTVYTTVLA